MITEDDIGNGSVGGRELLIARVILSPLVGESAYAQKDKNANEWSRTSSSP